MILKVLGMILNDQGRKTKFKAICYFKSISNELYIDEIAYFNMVRFEA